MKTFLLFVIVVLLGAIAWFLYQDTKKTPMEQAADDVSKAVEGAVKKIEGIFETK